MDDRQSQNTEPKKKLGNDAKLIGAVTHVFVMDSTKGYGIFAETMLEQLK